MGMGLLIDSTRCIGCGACSSACKEQNKLPEKVEEVLTAYTWTVVQPKEGLNVRTFCMHCEVPTCASVCPVGALTKTAEGPVVYDAERCMGCRYCMMACPFEIPKYQWDRPVPVMGKCILCADRVKEGKPTAVSDVDEMRHQMDSAIGSVRRIAAELRPRVMDDLDFKEALTWQTKEFFKHSGIQIELDLDAADRVKEDGLATALFRIVQEALTNVVRHSGADKVLVSLHHANDQLTLVVSDNGRGFVLDGGSGGVGLVSMRERCGAIGALFNVNSYPGAGTRIEVAVTMPDQNSSERAT